MGETLITIGEFLTAYVTVPILVVFLIGWLVRKYKQNRKR